MAQQTHSADTNQPQSVQNSMHTQQSAAMRPDASSLFDQDVSQVVRTKRTLPLKLIAAGAAVLVVACVAWFAQPHKADVAKKGTKDNPVVVGVVGANDPQWRTFVDEAQKQGIYVELKNFTDYTSENPALAQGSLDLNEFQHILYLANYNVKNDQDLQPIGGVAIYPLGLYSKQFKAKEDIPANTTVTIPNDETNQARALGVIESAGLIKIKNGWTPFVTPRDIDKEHSRVHVQPVEAAKVANSLSDPSVSAAVINNDYIKDAGIKAQDALFRDSAETDTAKPYVNVWVSRKEDANNETYKKLVEIWHSDAVSKALSDKLDNTGVLNNDSPEALQETLEKTQEALKASLASK